MDVVFALIAILSVFLLGTAPIIIFIIGIVKKTMRWPSFAFNLVVFVINLMMALFIGFVVPKNEVTKASAFDVWLPAIIGALALAAAIKSLSYKNPGKSNAPDKASPLGWVFLVGGELAYLYGFLIAHQYIFAPEGTHFVREEIGSNVFMMNLAWFAGCALCYLASRYDSAKIPDLLRWIAMGSGFFFVAITPSVVTAVLLAPPNLMTVSLVMLGYIPLIIMFTLLARDFHRPVAPVGAMQERVNSQLDRMAQ